MHDTGSLTPGVNAVQEFDPSQKGAGQVSQQLQFLRESLDKNDILLEQLKERLSRVILAESEVAGALSLKPNEPELVNLALCVKECVRQATAQGDRINKLLQEIEI